MDSRGVDPAMTAVDVVAFAAEARGTLDPDCDNPGDGEPEPETGPLRQCIVTRERLPKERMIRFVIGPDHQLVPDLVARLPGRGMWLSASGDVVEELPRAQDDGRGKEKRGGGLADRRLTRAFPGPLAALFQCPLIFLRFFRRRWCGG